MRTKILLVVGLIISLMGMTACTGPMGPMGPAGKNGKDAEVDLKVIDFTIESGDWQLVWEGEGANAKPLFQYEFECPELTAEAFDYGLVQVFFYTEVNNGTDRYMVQQPLPQTIYDQEGLKTFAETYTFETSVGYINFMVSNNLLDEYTKPLTRDFHVVIMVPALNQH